MKRDFIWLTFFRFLPLFVLLALWEFGAALGVDEFYVSKPSKIVVRLYDELASGSIMPDLQVTIVEIVLGYVIGSVSGVILGYFLAVREGIRKVLDPYLITLQGVPKSAIAPLFIIWMGIGIWSKVAVAASMVFFLVFYNTLLGMRMVNDEFVNLARIMGASEWDVTRRVVLPSIFPYILTGLKMSLPYAIIGVMVGEFIGSRAGIGSYILRATNEFDPAGTFVGIILLVFMVLVGNVLVDWAERHLLRWRPKRELLVTGA
jgi:NitT/TauT family transport system permease protein